MKKIVYFCSVITVFLLLVGCNQTGGAPVKSTTKAQTKAEIMKDDFIYRLFTEKGTYQKREDVKLYAELEYIGELDSITIYHAASPFYFDITEKIRIYNRLSDG